ncbi:MAG: hypothetical protein RR350_08360 [Oscillibacter sp.]
MKKELAFLWAALLLTTILSGCGEDPSNTNRAVPNTGVTSDQMMDGGMNGVKNDMKNGGTHSPMQGGASYGQMLRNGRVHDRDGYLGDRENAHTPGSTF